MTGHVHNEQCPLFARRFNTEDENLESLIESNRQWAQEVVQKDSEFFKHLAEKQEPKILWIGCSDSRVPAEQILQLGPGEVFVHRNIANVVSNTDLSSLSVLQYAVEVLKVEHIIVCGHYNCGGIATALGHAQVGLIDNWLRSIKDVYQHNLKELKNAEDSVSRLRRLVELNAINSAETVTNSTIVQNAWKRGQKLSVHAWTFDLSDGHIRQLDFKAKDFSAIKDIYITT